MDCTVTMGPLKSGASCLDTCTVDRQPGYATWTRGIADYGVPPTNSPDPVATPPPRRDLTVTRTWISEDGASVQTAARKLCAPRVRQAA